MNNQTAKTPPNFWEHSPGQRLAWCEYGDPNGAPVFYYHGWPSSRLQANLAHDLAKERNLRLIAMDRPGMGQSTLIENRKLEDWPALIASFADHLGIEKFGQIGVSGGGPYVLACAAAIPERLTASAVLAGMVPLPLLGLGPEGLHPLYRLLIPLRKAPSSIFTQGFRLASLMTKSQPTALPVSLMVKSLAKEDRELLLGDPNLWTLSTTSFTEGVTGPSGGKGIMTDAEIYLMKSSIEVEKIDHPIHYWHGGDDKNIPTSLVESLTGKMPNSTLTIDPELGHFSLALRRAPDALDLMESSTGA
ncbi:alpha/beta fold hydrolase [Luteolibacter sp. AS25]|uniref:alpha/beta fold hydrolase n=1 Tax=Luteolibacter sp. AS25 TaxID=3135776 RepID=UPI00398ACA42